MTARPPRGATAAEDVADAVARIFVALRARFDQITRRAAEHFASRDWSGVTRDSRARLLLYAQLTDIVTGEARRLLGDRATDRAAWAEARARFAEWLDDRHDREIAATFYNSVVRRVLGTVGVEPAVEFLGEELDGGTPRALDVKRTPPGAQTPAALAALLRSLPIGGRWRDESRTAERVLAIVERGLADAGGGTADVVELLACPFYRNKGAYVIGRAWSGDVTIPVVIALVHDQSGVHADAVLTTSDEASVVFGFSWSYFHVTVDSPRALVDYLAALMPLKRRDELYTAIGYHKHGKTELYRGLRDHLARTGARFERAPGQPGLVMTVLALPSFNLVLKVIRDSFGFPKRVTRGEVMAHYRYVFLRDRVGRLADAQEFERLELPRSAFPEPLLAELVAEAPTSVLPENAHVVFAHCYAQRQLVPLDVHLRTAPHAEALAAIGDYGQAIEDLAHAGVFPGDMLLKNFGLSRHGRVIFYDYDEIEELDEVVFRRLPEGDLDDELAAEPWFSVGGHDVFPEEFIPFLVPAGPFRDEFLGMHRHLLTPEWWDDVQARLRKGELFDVFPYPESRRLT